MPITKQNLRLRFNTHLNQTFDINIPNIRTDLTESEILQAMNMVVDAQGLASTHGRPTSPLNARITETTRTAYDLN